MKIRIFITWILLMLIANNVNGYAGPFSELWTVTDVGDGGYFEGDVRFPVLKDSNAWKAIIKFDMPVKGFKVSKAILVSATNETQFEVKNLPWNAVINEGDTLHFGMSGHTKKGLPSVRIRFKNKVFGAPEDSEINEVQPGKMTKLINAEVDYEKALDLSFKFFDAQRSGYAAADSEVEWKSDSGLYDGGDENLDLIGGYYISGDYVKFNFPMAFAVTQLGWGTLEYGDAYELTGTMEKMFKLIKWATDYFIKLNPKRAVVYGMIGDPELDHKKWESSSNMDWERPSYKITEDNPGSDLVGELSAALSMASMLFSGVLPEYSKQLLGKARALYKFADGSQGRYDSFSIPQAAKYYSSTGYWDELIWASLWLYKATGEEKYLRYARDNYAKLGDSVNNTNSGLSYDNKVLGIQILLADATGDDSYMAPVKKFCDTPGGTDAFLMPDGLIYSEVKDGPIHFAANAAFVCSLAATRTLGSKSSDSYLDFAKTQVHRILGARGLNSYMIGFGENFPRKPHHRDSSCPKAPAKCGWETFNGPAPNIYQLDGALVGGPNKDGIFQDSRNNYQTNQPNILYNSAFQSTLAALIAHRENLLEGSGSEGSGELPWDPLTFTPSDALILDTDENLIPDFDACVSNPCQNNAECVTINQMDFFCRCPFNTVGRFCENTLNPTIQWMTTWETGAQLHIHLPTEMKPENKRLKIVWPSGCPITLVKSWNTCIIPSLSSTRNRTIVFQQVSWQNDIDFIGMTFEFKEVAHFRACTNTDDFRFKISNADSNDPESSQFTPENCPKNEPDVKQPTESTTVSTIPFAVSDSIPRLVWMNSWGSGGQAHINIVDFKPNMDGAWSLRMKAPPQCSISSIQFWNGCVIGDQTHFSRGSFQLEQIGWQLDHDFIGMTIHFQTFSSNPADCFNQDLYEFTFKERESIQNLDPDTCKKMYSLQFDAESNGNDTDASTIKLAIGNNLPQNVFLSGENSSPISGVDGLKAEVVAPNTIQLTWNRVGDNADKLEITYIPFSEDGQNDLNVAVIKSSGANKQPGSFKPGSVSPPHFDISAAKKKAYINSLKAGMKYKLEVRPKGYGMEQVPPSVVTVRLDPEDITEICTSVIDTSIITLDWKKPLGYQTGYEISYFPEEVSSYPASPFKVQGNSTEASVKGLKANTEYVFIVRVISEDIMSNGKFVFTKTTENQCDYIICAQHATCVTSNTGSYCQCKFGYRGDGNAYCEDANECLAANDCDANAHCFNTIGSYKCKCALGYAGDGYDCYDIDECVAFPGICPRGSSCVNEMGTFECLCDDGFVMKNGRCVDVDECEVGNRRCPGGVCVNTIGSYQCKCNNGFKYEENVCKDINECVDKTHTCPRNAICINAIGSYACVCSKGFRTESDGRCTDNNECKNLSRKQVCRGNSICKNKIGGFLCQCKPGFGGLFCTDTDECKSSLLNNCTKDQQCLNVIGSFKCV